MTGTSCGVGRKRGSSPILEHAVYKAVPVVSDIVDEGGDGEGEGEEGEGEGEGEEDTEDGAEESEDAQDDVTDATGSK